MNQNGPKWSPSWLSELFWIFPEWLMWSFSILDGHFKGYRSQYKSWRGHGVAHEGQQNAPKLTKIVTISLQSKLFWINPEWLMRSVSGLEGHMIWVRARHGGVMGHTWGALKCAKMYQNGPKWTKIVQNGQYSMTEQNCFEFVLSNLSDLFMDGKKPWKGIGVSIGWFLKRFHFVFFESSWFLRKKRI